MNRRESRLRFRPWQLLLLVMLGGLTLTAGRWLHLGFLLAGDAFGYFAPAWSLFSDGDFVTTDEFLHFTQTDPQRYSGSLHPTSPQSPGMTFLLMPALVPAWLLGLGPLGYELLWSVAAVAVGWAGVWFMYRTVREHGIGGWAAAWAVTAAVTATPVSYYLVLEVGMAHATSAALVAATLWVWLGRPWGRHAGWAAALALLLGVAIWVRPQNVTFAALIPAGWWLHRGRRPQIRCLVIAAAAPVLGLAFTLGAEWLQGIGFGEASLVQQGQIDKPDRGFDFAKPAFDNVLLWGQRPIFFWHPMLLLVAAGLVVGVRTRPRVAVPLVLVLILNLYIIASWFVGWQGASVGTRMLSNGTAVYALALAWLFTTVPAGRPRKWLAGAAVACLLWSGWMTLLYLANRVPIAQPVTIRQVLLLDPRDPATIEMDHDAPRS